MRIVAIRVMQVRAAMASFYQALGLSTDLESRTGEWIELAADGFSRGHGSSLRTTSGPY